MQSTPVTLSNSDKQYRLTTDESDPNRPRVVVEVLDSEDALLGNAMRLWEQDGRTTADLPGVNSTHFHLIDNHIEINE